jgi:hypothetical protein
MIAEDVNPGSARVSDRYEPVRRVTVSGRLASIP